jgi:hypothetical protein
MSVTFMAPEAPEAIHTWTCNSCEGKGCDWCEGNGEVSEWLRPFECNFSNSTAYSVLRALGHQPKDLWGEILPEDLPEWIKRCTDFIGGREAEIYAWELHQPSMGFINLDDPFTIASRVVRIKRLLEFANEGGYRVTWG